MNGIEETEELPIARQKSNALVSFACGVLFAIGLGLAGMTSPAKVLAFLDVTSESWDPSLAFVMVGAIGVHFVFARRAATGGAAGRTPISAGRFHLPARTTIDRSLLGGAALFGVGWGIAGYCPGPGLVAFIVTPIAVIFVGAMLAGMWGTRVVRERLAMRAENRATALALERAIQEALKPERDRTASSEAHDANDANDANDAGNKHRSKKERKARKNRNKKPVASS